MKRRIFCLFLIVLLLLPTLAVETRAASFTTPKDMTQRDVETRMEDLIALADAGVFYTYNGKACNTTFVSGHGGSSCKNCESGVGAGKVLNSSSAFMKHVDNFRPSDYADRSSSSGQFRHYYGKNGSTQIFKGYSCAGFANYAGWYIFAQKTTDAVKFDFLKFGEYTASTMASAKPGDIIRLGKTASSGTHSAIVVSVGSSGVSVLDCNGISGKNRQCQLNVHTIKYSSSYDYVCISRARNYLDCIEHVYSYGCCVNCGEMQESFADYLKNECTFYDTNLIMEVVSEYPLRSLPLSPTAENDSENVVTLPAYSNVIVTGLYQNHYGNYWYAVEYEGATRFLYSEKAAFLAVVAPKISGPVVPETVNHKSSFSIGGNITSRNKLIKVAAEIRDGDNPSTLVLDSSAAPNALSYSLKGSTVDNKLKFGSLDVGDYLYQINARVEYHIASGKDLRKETTGWFTLVETPFSVEHNYSSKVTAPTCTAGGYTTHTCACGKNYQDSKTSALGHDYSSALEGMPCQGTAQMRHTCDRCGDTYTTPSSLPKKHDYSGSGGACIYCGQVNSLVTLLPKPNPGMGGSNLNINFGASGLDQTEQTEFFAVIALYDAWSRQMLDCQTGMVTREELEQATPQLSVSVPDGVLVFWKAFLLDPDTMEPVSEAVSKVLESSIQ